MRNDYIITTDELARRGINLNECCLDSSCVIATIYNALSLCVERFCFLADFSSERECEEYLSKDDDKRTSQDKVRAFKEIQYWVLYNLMWIHDQDPRNQTVDNIFVYQLGCKINGIQKGIARKVD